MNLVTDECYGCKALSENYKPFLYILNCISVFILSNICFKPMTFLISITVMILPQIYASLPTTWYKLHTTRFTLHTAHYKLHTTPCDLNTVHYTLSTKHCTLHTSHCALHTGQCTLYTTHYSLLTLHRKLYVPLYRLELHLHLIGDYEAR